MLEGVEQTALRQTLLINDIKELMDNTKEQLKLKLPKIYFKDLLEILFMHPYTKISILKSVKVGIHKFFVNVKLFELLQKAMPNCKVKS